MDVNKRSHQALTSTAMKTEEIQHQRYGHINHDDFMLLQKKSMGEGLHVMKNEHIECKACALGKHRVNGLPIHKYKIQI